jgi:uncharacterized protein
MEKKRQATNQQVSTSALPAARERQRRTEFMVACASGDVDKVQRMLSDGADPNYVSDLGGTPLTWAAAWDREEVVECLLDNGAEVELPDRPAWSALMHAASRGNRAIVCLLMARGADPFRKDMHGQLPVDLATEAGRLDCAFLLQQLARIAEQPSRCRRAQLRHQPRHHPRHPPRHPGSRHGRPWLRSSLVF